MILRDKILDDLSKSEYGEILRYNPNAEKYSFSNPFFQAFIKMKIAIEKVSENEKATRKKDYELYEITKQKIENMDYLESIFEIMESDFKKSSVVVNTNYLNGMKGKTNFNKEYLPKNLKYQNKIIKKGRK